MEKVLWIDSEKDYDGRNTGCLIDAADVENSVYLGYDLVRIWDAIPGSQEPTIPAVIEWDGERYDSIREMYDDYAIAYLDSLVGAESRAAQNWEPAERVLAYSFDEHSFGSPADWEITKTYTYFKNSNRTTIYLGGHDTEYEIGIIDSYNLDFIDYARNSTNCEFGGLGNHAILHKVRVDGEPSDLLLWHEWSQWAGSELDTGELVTTTEALSRLVWLRYCEEEKHPEYDDIAAWIAQ